ncbi:MULTISPECIES: alpha/beta hydrolase [unclassified Pseudofrankia]|uniref:alpha/beta hydrolase n=1 Tax=unclassified Pseudofrankia TaxID=2994372 RepID=UPI0008DA841F|nr:MULTISPECIES: alpha/beta hydrolase [unclassified Pseudofrankia]MDT3445169.1 alpha/beta hydrolase [Pseudofrankia sp. BMG5.37]OHV63234.1 alpha/beta hydrolase [Pseudofrankia sp. BMG5.36]
MTPTLIPAVPSARPPEARARTDAASPGTRQNDAHRRDTRSWPSAEPERDPRGAVVVLPGRGESAELFEPLAFRLALDGYEVTYLGMGEDSTLALGECRVPGRPFALVGSDTGALRALAVAGSPALRTDALVLLGLPLLYRPVAGEIPSEPPPRALPDLPILLVHGVGDEVSPLQVVRMTTRTASRARLVAVPGGHQVLTETSWRATAAHTIAFLEDVATAPAHWVPAGSA